MCVLKMKFLPSVVQKLSSEQTHRQKDGQTDRWTDRQTHTHIHRQTDRQTRLKLLPTAYADGNNNNIAWENIGHLLIVKTCFPM